MEIIFLLVLVSVIISVIFLFLFIWATKNGQFDDTYTPSVRMLFDDEYENQDNDNDNELKNEDEKTDNEAKLGK